MERDAHGDVTNSGDVSAETVNAWCFWDVEDARGVMDTRRLWGPRHDHLLDPLIVELNSQLERAERRRRST